ncbi:uncharacterized protein OGAPODRAFT_92016 [Ogataea polymorpha]|uniref:uncharacterized protein n=1 Tax=Ogataea polymorpha TaxID=460523 RepID=UPI0007F32B03|nr:uncharacterized protein OGAPODRAFT_92016 [Ogataea polymorpha]KAG7931446.1 hypothetical protein KL904_005141 [Ogataea polymorpha]OBA18536.1 hypothetical protein OGAPODRAFT_92016 [Ogataea polymorpha]
MSISARLSIAWESSSKPEENTSTMVLSTPSERFVDVRPLLTPCGDFPFEWAFAGSARLLAPDGSQIEFSHDFFDSDYIRRWCECRKRELAGETVQYPLKSDIPKDIGHFETLQDGTRRETGTMYNPGSGTEEQYEERWVSLDPWKTTPQHKVQAGSTVAAESRLFDVKSGGEGRFVRVGNWAQGVFWNKDNLDTPISVVRVFFDGRWNPVLQHGDCSMFPVGENPAVGAIVSKGTVTWEVLE